MRTLTAISLTGILVFVGFQFINSNKNNDNSYNDKERTIPVHIVVTMDPDPTVMGITWKIGPEHNNAKDIIQSGKSWGVTRRAKVGDNVLVEAVRAQGQVPSGGQTCRIIIRGKQMGTDISTTGFDRLICAATVA